MRKLPEPTPEALARRKLFTEALRSGEFLQGKGQLSTYVGDDGDKDMWLHCCLGVACIVAIRNGLDLPFADYGNTRFYSWDGKADDVDFRNSTSLPTSVMRWYEFPDSDPDIPVTEVDEDEGTGTESTYEYPASTVNDDKNRDFAYIADAFDNAYVHPFEAPEDPSGALEP